jgi:dipeptidase E
MPGDLVAMGGGGFDGDNPLPEFDSWFLNLTGVAKPRLTFIPTATGDSDYRIARFKEAARHQGVEAFILSLYWPESRDDLKRVLDSDAVFVGGGNTYNMIALWKLWRLDEILKQAHQQGTLLGGVSAGANCWFEECSTDSFGRALEVIPALGWVEGSFCPHYHGEAERKPTLARFLESREMKAGWAADDYACLRISPDSRKEAFSFEPEALVYEVGAPEGAFIETPLVTTLIS